MLRVFLCYHLRRDEPRNIIFRIAACFFVVLFGWRGKRGERELGDGHAGAEDYGHVVEIAEFKRNLEEVAGVNKRCAVMVQEADSGERTLAVHLDEVVVGAEIIF